MKTLHIAAFLLLVLGGLNWFLVAFGHNVVDAVFGAGSGVSTVVYIILGLSAFFEAVMHKRHCKECAGSGM